VISSVSISSCVRKAAYCDAEHADHNCVWQESFEGNAHGVIRWRERCGLGGGGFNGGLGGMQSASTLSERNPAALLSVVQASASLRREVSGVSKVVCTVRSRDNIPAAPSPIQP
jgi:hypothetical protein